MMRNSVTSAKCACGLTERLARHKSYPILINRSGKYELFDWDRTSSCVVRHCMFCGGVVSPSSESEFGRSFDPAELEEIREQTKHVSSPYIDFL